MQHIEARKKLFEERLFKTIISTFPYVEQVVLDEIDNLVEWMEIEAGQQLFAQGDASDSLYILLSGRLQAMDESDPNQPKLLGDILSGQSVGEIGVFTGEPRSASVYAIRNSVLVKISAQSYLQLIARFPSLALSTGKIIVDRLQPGRKSHASTMLVSNIALLPLHKGFNKKIFTQKLSHALNHHGKVQVLHSDNIDQYLTGDKDKPDVLNSADVQLRLDKIEMDNDFVIYLADAETTEWTLVCMKQADEIYKLADSAQGIDSTLDTEARLLYDENSVTLARKHMVLVHSDETRLPKHVSDLLKDRDLKLNHNIRWNRTSDYERLARYMAGKAVGIALAGGGARGLIHLGIFKAFRECNIPFDMIAGTSAGSLALAIIAQDFQPEQEYEYLQMLCKASPTTRKYRSVFPLISLLKGSGMDNYTRHFFGDIHMEDLWFKSIVVASNLSKSSLQVFESGSLGTAIRASISLPGIFPPAVYNNDLLVDGATIQNLPLQAMYGKGAGILGAISLHTTRAYHFKHPVIPEAPKLLFDKLTGQRKYRTPSIISIIMNSMTLASNSHLAELRNQADLFLSPDTTGISLMEWMKYDYALDIGYRYAMDNMDVIRQALVK